MVYFCGASFCKAALHLTIYSWCIATVLCRPMPLAVKPSEEEYLQMEPEYAVVKNAFARGQHLVTVLNQIFSTDNIKRRKLLQYCFGKVPEANIPIIIANIATLANPQSYVSIQDVIEKENTMNKGLFAYVIDDTNPWRLTITEKFHKLPNVDDQAGILVHEISHILLGLYDYFEKAAPHLATFQPDLEFPAYTGPPVWHGYDDLHILTDRAPEVTHNNADSYAVAAIMAGRIEHLETEKEITQAIANRHAFSKDTSPTSSSSDHKHNKAGPSKSKKSKGSKRPHGK